MAPNIGIGSSVSDDARSESPLTIDDVHDNEVAKHTPQDDDDVDQLLTPLTARRYHFNFNQNKSQFELNSPSNHKQQQTSHEKQLQATLSSILILDSPTNPRVESLLSSYNGQLIPIGTNILQGLRNAAPTSLAARVGDYNENLFYEMEKKDMDLESIIRSTTSTSTANNNNEIAGAVSAGASASSSFASSPTDASSVCVDTTDAEQQVKSLYFSHEASLEMHAPTDDPPRWGEEMDDDLLNMFDDIDNLDDPIFGGGYVVATSDGQLKEFYSHPKAFNKKEGEPPSFLDINAHPQDSLQVDVKPSASEEASPNNHIFDDSFTLGDMPHVSQSHSQDNDGLDTSFNERGNVNVFDNGPVFYDNVDDTTEGFSTNDYTETLLLQESISTTSLPPLMLRTLPESQDIPQAQGDHQVTPLLGEAKCDSLPIVTPKSGELNKGTLPQSKVSSLPLSMSQKSSNGLHQRSNGNSCINDNAVAPTPRGQGKEHQAQRHDVTWKRRFAELEVCGHLLYHCSIFINADIP